MKRFAGFIILFAVLTGCGKGGPDFFAAHHYTTLEDSEGKRIAFLDWGEPLELVKEEKPSRPEFIKVKVASIEETGYVKEKSLMKNVLSKAVLLKEKTVYKTPSIHSRESAIAQFPMLCIIKQIKELEGQGTWAEVNFYNAPEDFNLKKNMAKIYGDYWIKLEDLSTDKSDVAIVKSVQLFLYQYRLAVKSKRKDLDAEVKRLRKVLENIIET
ncbi:MAG: hypothetical protein CVV50_03200, partial [Spirochaetae bacterium HGW-Spirochaetae-6]